MGVATLGGDRGRQTERTCCKNLIEGESFQGIGLLFGGEFATFTWVAHETSIRRDRAAFNRCSDRVIRIAIKPPEFNPNAERDIGAERLMVMVAVTQAV
jgi:hypothetical protein